MTNRKTRYARHFSVAEMHKANRKDQLRRELEKRKVWRTMKFEKTPFFSLSSTTRKLFRKRGIRIEEVKAFRPSRSRHHYSEPDRKFWVFITYNNGTNSFSNGYRVMENVKKTSDDVWNEFSRLGRDSFKEKLKNEIKIGQYAKRSSL